MASRRVSKKMQAVQEVAATSETTKRAVIYVRVSTEEQVDGFGLDVQKARCQAFAESQGYQVVDTIEDGGFSGSNTNRPGLQRVLEMAANREMDVVLVYKFDRLSRSVADALTLVDKGLTAYGVALRSVSEPVNTSDEMGRFFFTLLSSFAELERGTITKRTLDGRMEKASGGGFAGGTAPLGYRRNKEGGLEIDPEEALVVKHIFDLRAQGMGFKLIAKTLTQEGVKTKRGGQWHPVTVRTILENVKYRGMVEYFFEAKGVHVLRAGDHQAIISDQDFQAAV